VSLGLHWLSPKDARRFVEAARALGHLKPGERPGTVGPAFDVRAVEVPIDFRLEPAHLEGVGAGRSAVADELVERAAAALGRAPADVWREVERKQAQVLVMRPVAAALVAAEAGVDVRPFAHRIEEELAALGRPTSSAS
jgi:hypothetical protein